MIQHLSSRMVFQVFSIHSLITETVRRQQVRLCVCLVTKCQAIDDPTCPPLHHALRRVFYNLGSSINKLALILVLLHTRNTIHATYLFSWVSWCLRVAWILVLLTLLFAFGRNAGTEHRFHCPVRMTMVIIEPPLAPRRLCLRPSPRLSTGVVLVSCASRHVAQRQHLQVSGWLATIQKHLDSRSFTVTIDCTSCQRIRSSNLGELFPTHFIKTAPVHFAAMLYFTSPWLFQSTSLNSLTCYLSASIVAD